MLRLVNKSLLRSNANRAIYGFARSRKSSLCVPPALCRRESSRSTSQAPGLGVYSERLSGRLRGIKNPSDEVTRLIHLLDGRDHDAPNIGSQETTGNNLNDLTNEILQIIPRLLEDGLPGVAHAIVHDLITFQSQSPPGLLRKDILASTLEVKSLVLRDKGEGRMALGSAADATESWKKVVAEEGPTFTVRLAASFMNLGCRHDDIGEPELAADAFKRSIALLRPYSNSLSSLDRFKTLGQALLQLSLVQAHQDPPSSLEAITEVADMARSALDESGAEFLPTMVETSAALIQQYFVIGDVQSVVRTVEEQLKIYMPLASRLEGDIRREAASALTDIAALVARYDIPQMAIEICNIAEEGLPSHANEILARIGFVRATSLSALGSDDRAIEAIQRCIQLYENDSSLLPLAACYNERARILGGLKRWEEALAASERALDLQKSVVSSNGDIGSIEVVNLAVYTIQLSQTMLGMGQLQDASKLANEAIALCQKHLNIHSSHLHLATAKFTLLQVHAELQAHEYVIQLAEEVQVVLQNLLDDPVVAAQALQMLVETLELAMSSLKVLRREDDLAAAEELLQCLSSGPSGRLPDTRSSATDAHR
ncbi:hypothetical protein FRB99_006226 [Tulasnella sp. 403]|nr:hypothetical protein FRB99_006226 [Tulasnella sp. 403]